MSSFEDIKKSVIGTVFLITFLGLASLFEAFAETDNPQATNEDEFAGTYVSNWESLDRRPIPQWFEDAKIGIFVHWGVYSVPSYSPVGTYTEWYQFWLQEERLFGNFSPQRDAVAVNHRKVYGDHKTYYDLAEDFGAEYFDADEWVDLFENAGAKYVIFTAKHHDGFALWPNNHANGRGFAWNSVSVGPKRDLVGELAEALKQSPVRFGLYYSLFEWYHPDWEKMATRASYVDDHMLPQMKELVDRYEPEILYPDGDWWMPSDKYKSKEFLTWLFNESKVASTILVNDRWGRYTRSNHGGYYTSEYKMGAEFDKPWEEVRGLGYSFGFNRAENADDYNSPQALVLMLADIVSRGGNLCLNIGPGPDGKIPPIMEHHLREIGKWLKRNEEAIYGSRQWRRSVQWGVGQQNYDRYFEEKYSHYVGGDYILSQTLDVPDGYAAKEAFFTQKEDDLFVILPRWQNKFTLKDFQASDKMRATLLATGAKVGIQNEGDNTILNLPTSEFDNLQVYDLYAIVIKIERGAT